MSRSGQRIDKWLWFARILKTRTAAAKFVASGRVRLNRTRIEKPSHAVAPDDVLTFMLHERVRVLKVLAPGRRRGPAGEALLLYTDLSPDAAAAAAAPAARLAGAGRPTKRERREIDAWRDPRE